MKSQFRHHAMGFEAVHGSIQAALMSLTMLVEDEGRNYTAAEYHQWLTDAGFTDLRRVTVDVPGANGFLMPAKPWQA